MRDFESYKREILARVDLVDVVGEHVALKQRGKGYVGLCPFHSEKTPSFTVTPDRGLFKCFGCGKGGDLFTFVMERENLPFMEAMRILADRAGVSLGVAEQSDSAAPGRSDLGRVNAWAEKFFRSKLLSGHVGRAARAYLQGRRISDAASESFKLGLATDLGETLTAAASKAGISRKLLLAADLVRESDDGRVYETFRNRLMFPIRDATGRVIGFGGRTLADDRAKYLNTRQTALFDKGRNLYGIDLARKAAGERKRLVIVEGYTDCLAAHQAGFSETVATLGVALTEPQVDLIRRYCDEIVLLFDSDDAGDAAAERAIRVAYPRCVKVRLARIKEGKDPSDYIAIAGAEGFSDVLKEAVDALEFKWAKTSARFKGGDSEAARREAVMDFLGLIAEACGTSAVDAIERGLLVNRIAHLLQMDGREVHAVIGRLSKKRARSASPAPGEVKKEHRPPSDEEQAAWTLLLEAVLAKRCPVDEAITPAELKRIADERDRRIACVVFSLLDKADGEIQMTDVLAGCGGSGDAERVEELSRRGLARGNYDTTIRMAVERIRRALKNEDVERSKRKFADAQPGLGSIEEARDQFNEFVTGVREHRHFVPRRQRRGREVPGTDTIPPDDVATVEQL